MGTHVDGKARWAGAIRPHVRWRRVLLFALCFGLLVTAVGMMLALLPFFDKHSDPQGRQYLMNRCLALGVPVFVYGAILALAAVVGLRVQRYRRSTRRSRK